MSEKTSVSEHLSVIYCIKTIDFIEKLINSNNIGLYQSQIIQTLSKDLSDIIKTISYIKVVNPNLKKFIENYLNNINNDINKNLEISIFDSNDNLSNDLDLETIIGSKKKTENVKDIQLTKGIDKLGKKYSFISISKNTDCKNESINELSNISGILDKTVMPYQVDKKLYVDKFSNYTDKKFKTKYGRNVKKINYKI